MTNLYCDISRQNTWAVSRIYSTLSLGMCMLFIVMTVSQYIISMVAVSLSYSVVNQGWFYLFLSDVPIYCIGLWVFLFYAKKLEAKKPVKRNFGVGDYFAILPVAFFFMIAGSFVGVYVDSYAQALFGVETESSLSQVTSTMSLTVEIFYLSIIAPFGEEFIFRKIILDRTANYGEGCAIMFSAITFALFHGNLEQGFYAFGAGLLLAYVYVRTGNYFLCVGVHSVVNTVFGIIIPRFYDVLETEGNKILTTIASTAILFQWAFAVLGLIILIVYLVKNKIRMEKSLYTFQFPVSKVAFTNAPFVVFAAYIGLLVVENYIP